MRIAVTSSLVDEAYRALTEAIYDGTYAPGSFIRINQLAEALGISITPTREALARAAAERLLIHDPNRGFAVAPMLSPPEYESLFAARLLLEDAAVRQIVAPAEIAQRLQPLVDQMRASSDGTSYDAFTGFRAADRAFHRELVGAASSPFVLIAWESLHFHLHVSRLYGARGVVDASHGIAEHAAIIAALRAGDVERARLALTRHVQAAKARLRQLLPTDDRPAPG